MYVHQYIDVGCILNIHMQRVKRTCVVIAMIKTKMGPRNGMCTDVFVSVGYLLRTLLPVSLCPGIFVMSMHILIFLDFPIARCHTTTTSPPLRCQYTALFFLSSASHPTALLTCRNSSSLAHAKAKLSQAARKRPKQNIYMLHLACKVHA